MSTIRFASAQECSKCGSREIARSHRKNPLEFALSVLVLPWRCRVCYHRFFRHRFFRPADATTQRPAEKSSATAA